jgi:GT2 family glycosyltransferase
MALVPIIIPFYKEHEKLAKCLAAIEAQSHDACETFVRDNSDDNILFTAAVNEGLAKYCYRPDVQYVIVLNQDAYMDPDCVRRLVEFMDAHPDCGIACPFQYTETASGRKVTWGGSLTAFPDGVHRHGDLARDREPFETFWANGACMMIRTQAVREVGQFDRNMRFICSDSDFSFSARARGWKVYVVPAALAQHALGGSGKGGDLAIQLVKCRDVVYFAEKWLTGGLYRRMAFEGAGLTGIDVRRTLRKYRDHIATLERMLGVAPQGEQPAYRSPLAEFRLPALPRRPGSF